MRPRALAALVLAAALVPAVGAVLAAGTGGRVDLQVLTRELDTRTIGDGAKVETAVIGSGAFNVTAFYPDAAGRAVIHPCTESAPADEATFRFTGPVEGAPVEIKHAMIVTGETVCLSSTTPLHVIVDRRGTVTPTPEPDRSQYVALPSPVELYDSTTTANEQVIQLPLPAELSDAATAAVLSLEVISADARGYLTAYACAPGKERPQAADLTYEFGRTANISYVEFAPTDDLCVFAYAPVHVRVRLLGELAGDGPNPAALPPSWRFVAGEVPAPSLRSIVPERVLDTRFGVGRPGTAKVEPDEVVELDFGGLVSPLTTAVVLNVTVDQPEAEGFVTAWPCGGDRPVVSNLNFAPGETVPNLVVAKLGPSGTVCLSGIVRTHLIADLNGTFETDGGLLAQPVTPERILDTREPIGVPSVAKLAAGDTLELQVTGDVVPDEAGAATVNVTVTEPDGPGFITVYPCDQARPTASNLNYVAGQTVANLVTAKLSSDGRLCLYAFETTHLVADIAAWYGAEQPAGLVELSPERFLDTREPIGVPAIGKVAGNRFIALQVAGRGDVPGDATAVVMNITATETEGEGFVTAWPCDASMPTVSNLNYLPGETNPNLATVKLAADGTVCLYTYATAHLIADVAGYLTDQAVDGDVLTLE